ncbi:uncharacterized protein LOC115410640 [Sphaeramia orbicularis]|uniref:uncharacterized protein LOC115410640 n=1 Tax=Sphaeramia orbicularis TaxID=375764 RepID=UPI00117E9759|nr:uncharacterized protein LOC115410640 [Sphaeramia orbicularis]
MDSDNSVSRLERTFWAVWYYITDAVNRFLRPEPPQTASNDANSLQDSSVDSEHPISGNADVGISKEEDEEQPLATASLLSSSQQVVSWDVCTTDTDLGPEIENMQYKTQLSRSSEGKASEDGEATREEHFNQTGSNDADLLLSRDEEEKKDENADLNLYGDGRDVMLKNDEQLKSGSAIMTDILQDEGMEETGKNTDDEQRTGEVEEEVEEEEDHKDEDFTDYCRSYKLEAEESEVKLTEQSNMSTEEEKLPMDDADTTWAQIEVDNSDYMLHQASGPGPENQLSVCKQPSDDDTDSKGAPSMTLLDTVPHVELQMTDNNCGVVSDDALAVVGPEQTMADRSKGLAKSKAEEDHKEEEEESEMDEREHGAEEKGNVNEVTDQTKDEESEQEEDNEGLTESSQQDDIIAEGDSEGFTLNVKAEQHNNGGKNAEQAMTNENNEVMTKAISVNEELLT